VYSTRGTQWQSLNPKAKEDRFLFFFVLIVIACVIYGKYAQRVPPVSISQDKVVRRSLTEVVVANGKIEPVLEVQISPEVSGEIIQLEVKEGQRVKKGDLLLKIRPIITWRPAIPPEQFQICCRQ